MPSQPRHYVALLLDVEPYGPQMLMRTPPVQPESIATLIVWMTKTYPTVATIDIYDAETIHDIMADWPNVAGLQICHAVVVG